MAGTEASPRTAARRGRRTRLVRGGLPRWLLSVLALVVVLLTAPAGTASAHAVLESADPAADAVLAKAPATVSLHFSEPVETDLGALRVFGPGSGPRVDTPPVGHGNGGGSVVHIALRGGLGPGTYTVAWRVVSADSHPVSGAYTFVVGQPSAGGTAVHLPDSGAPRTVSVPFTVARGLAYAGFAVLCGGVPFLLLCAPGMAGRTRAWLPAAGSWGLLLVASLAVLLLQGPYGAGLGWGSVFDHDVVRATVHTRLGRALTVRVLLLGVLGVLLGVAAAVTARARRRTRVLLATLWVALCAGTAATWALSDHASVGRQRVLAETADVVHLLAMGGWLGGLVMLVVLLSRGRAPAADGTAEDGPGGDTAVVARFSRLALGCVSVLVATGLYAAWRQVGTFGALPDTVFGRLLLAKAGLVVLMVGSAWWARRVLHRRTFTRLLREPTAAGAAPTVRMLHRAVAVEVAFAVGVLGVTTALVNTEPARTAHARQQSASVGPRQHTVAYDTGGPGGTGTLDITLDTPRVGPNQLHVLVLGPGGTVRDVPEVTATMALPDRGVDGIPVLLTYAGPGHWRSSGLSLPMPGRWQLTVSVRTSDIDRATVVVPWEVT